MLTKLCIKCNTSKHLDAFHKRGSGLQNECKECRHLRYLASYQVSKIKYAATKAEYEQTLKEYIQVCKDIPCMDCKKQYPHYVMDFDHVRGEKKFNIGGSHIKYGIDTIKNEIDKCDVVCSNCHRERTHGSVGK